MGLTSRATVTLTSQCTASGSSCCLLLQSSLKSYTQSWQLLDKDRSDNVAEEDTFGLGAYALREHGLSYVLQMCITKATTLMAEWENKTKFKFLPLIIDAAKAAAPTGELDGDAVINRGIPVPVLFLPAGARAAHKRLVLRLLYVFRICLFVRPHLSRAHYITSYVTMQMQCIAAFGGLQAKLQQMKVVLCCLDGENVVASREDPGSLAYSY